ncbi:MAG: aminoacyl-tRNA hydrolase [Gammaproteobacteria bacterium]
MSGGIALIVGLGNPGREYEATRHNAGFWFVEALAQQRQVSFKSEKKFHGQLARFSHAGQDVWLLKPETFMNLSGQAVQAVCQFYKIPLENILVAHDELDLEPGIVRLKKGGGHGGHNGLRDIMSRMGKDFYRLRIGIGHPGQKEMVTGHVLSKVSADDERAIKTAIDDALRVVPEVLAGDLQKAMNQLHSSN